MPLQQLGSAMLTTGGTHACGVTQSGEGFCWGNNTRGQLGNGPPP